MRIAHLTSDDYSISNWSGGTTTQIFLHPADGDYTVRRFCVRISSATVEAESSTFTTLPGVWRYIAPLNSSFTLTHPGHHSAVLPPLTVDSFSGDWETACVGKARDLNLMLKDGWQGGMYRVSGDTLMLTPPKGDGFDALYFVTGGSCRVGAETYDMAAGDTLLLTWETGDAAVRVTLNASNPAVMRMRAFLPR